MGSLRFAIAASLIFALLTPAIGAQNQLAHSHVRLEYPISRQMAAMPVVTNLELSTPQAERMGSLGTNCDAVPPGSHERWAVKVGIQTALTSQAVLTQAIGHPYQVQDVIAAQNLSGLVSPATLDRSDAVDIAGDSHYEGDPVAVSGVILALGCEADGDTHIDLATSIQSATCLVVEVPNPNDIGPNDDAAELRAYLTSMWSPLRRRFTEIYDDSGEQPGVPYEITVVGQLYFDTDHRVAGDPGGGRGIQRNGKPCARNLWEVHSVLDMIEQNH